MMNMVALGFGIAAFYVYATNYKRSLVVRITALLLLFTGFSIWFNIPHINVRYLSIASVLMFFVMKFTRSFRFKFNRMFRTHF